MKYVPRTISLLDQILSSISHGVGLIFAIFALVIPLTTVHFITREQFIAYVIFASSLCFVYLASTLYHAFEATKIERIFHALDHGGIFFLIAGTYTPLILIAEHGLKVPIYLGFVWTVCAIGTTLKAIWPDNFRHLFLGIYLVLSWLSLFIMRDIALYAPHGTLTLILLGGAAYSIGAYFFANRRIPLQHTIWHLFVLVGSAFHVAAVVKL